MLNSGLKRLYKLSPRVKILHDFFVWDVETGEKHKEGDQEIIDWLLKGRPENFQFACIVGHNFRKVIYNLDELKQEFLDPRYKNKFVFAHNAPYDLNTTYGNIFSLDPTAIFNGSKFITATNGNCKFADSHNIFATSVKVLGKLLGLEKTGMTGNASYKRTIWSNEKEKNKAVNGCFRDCEIVWEGLIRIFEDSGDIKITQASLSMTYYRRFHQPFIIEHNSNTSYFWDSYYGGRTEALKIGKTHASVIDANSMYPYFMKETVFPNPKLLKVEKYLDVKYFLKHILPHFEGCIYCTVFHKENWIGYLPLKTDGKLLFPTGKIKGCWNFPEIRFALESGVIEIKEITKIVYGERMKSPFESYVDTLYQRRFSSDNEFEIYRVKIFMNSLYGKFAQRITEESIYIENIEKQWELVESYQKQGLFIKLIPFNSERLDYFLVLKSTKGINISYSIPSFSSYITTNARLHLLKKVIEMKDCKPVYMDTDSIFYEIEPKNFVSEKFLGGWKKENKIVTEIRGLKNYKYVDLEKDAGKEVHRIKGVPYLNDELIKYDGKEFKKCEKISDNEYRYFNLVNTKESLRRNLDAGVLTKRVKVITDKYDKRIVESNGETKPINL